MAIVSTGFKGTITLVDNNGNESSPSFAVVGATYVDALADLQAIATDLAAITNAEVAGYKLTENFDENALALPGDGVHVENIALLSCKISDAPEKWAQIRIPAPVIGIFVAATGSGAKQVDPNDAALLTYLGHFEAGGEATVSDGETLLASGPGNTTGKRIHRGSRNG